MTIGAQIKLLRKENELTQKDLAYFVGVKEKAVSLWETDVFYPSMENLRRICEIFRISAEEFFKGVNF